MSQEAQSGATPETAAASLTGVDAEKLELREICLAQAGNDEDMDRAARSTCGRQKGAAATVW